ncbi:hypothetical protein CDAR_516191 [Caerostris darwini]|uniref:Uncharacterized protein n=1 Tax=Caerostris darwini TaxID=1538125 RepID=A0AAV4X1U9_9ARAC|nr:hypothetical protein CDAR_516191 [Caerostris darwini]
MSWARLCCSRYSLRACSLGGYTQQGCLSDGPVANAAAKADFRLTAALKGKDYLVNINAWRNKYGIVFCATNKVNIFRRCWEKETANVVIEGVIS